jgi:hypothetical protein
MRAGGRIQSAVEASWVSKKFTEGTNLDRPVIALFACDHQRQFATAGFQASASLVGVSNA